jgi:puromycin-sensitive aminopeptidase
MWFGDLVTMKWWNGLWLNEAFASFMELKCVDAFRPEWNRWLSFAHERANAMDVDGLAATRPVEYPVASPEEAEGMFDTLTYGKGSAVLRMLEQFLGEETFRRGIASYLAEHAYSNTDTPDLWEALEAASGEPVGEIMANWIFQGGYPQLDVKRAEGGYRIEQRHFRFLGGGETKWKVPALYVTDDDSGRLVVEGSSFIPTAGDSVLLNHGGDGFYRVNYPEPLLRALAAELKTLQGAERYTLIADTWANVLAGETAAKDFLALVGELGGEVEPDVWAVAIGGLLELGRIISSDDRPSLEKMVRDLVGPRATELGWNTSPDDSHQARRLRALLLRTAGILGDDPEVQATARETVDLLADDPGAVDGDVADAAVGVVAANGSFADFELMLELRSKAASPQDEVRYLRAAAAVPEKDTALRLLDMILRGEVRSHDATWLVARLIGHRDTGRAVWERVKQDWDALLAAMPASYKWRMLDWIMYRSEPDLAEDIEQWLQDHPIPGAEQITAQQLERLRVRVGLREREASRLGEALP